MIHETGGGEGFVNWAVNLESQGRPRGKLKGGGAALRQ